MATPETTRPPLPDSHHLLPLLFQLLLLLPSPFITNVAASLPPPVQCTSTGCTVSYFQNIWLDRTPCLAGIAFYPSTEEDLVRAVAHAVRHNLKVKVISKDAHSITKLVCPGGSDGVVISTRDYNRGIYVNKTALTVTADSGVYLRELVDRVAEDGLTVPHLPNWDGLSVAGMISTGAHGTGWSDKGSAAHDYVVGVRLVVPSGPEDGYAKIVSLTEEDDELNAAKLSIGVLGAISQVTFALQPMFKRSVSLEIRNDEDLEDYILSFAKSHDHGGLAWYPAAQKAMFKVDDRVGLNVQGDGAYKLVLDDAIPVSVAESIRATEEAVEAQRDVQAVCRLSEDRLNKRISSGDGLLNDGVSFHGFPVVGFNHLMQTFGGCRHSVCLDVPPVGPATGVKACHESGALTCRWDPRFAGFFYYDSAISIPVSRIKDAIKDIKRIQHENPTALCGIGISGGFLLRFIKRSDAFLGEMEDAVVVEFMYYRSKESNTPRFNEDVIEEVEQLLLLKYGGKPHWGKNRDLCFEGMANRTVNLPKFLEVKRNLDPGGFFSSEWSNAILGISEPGARGVQIVRDYCALEGLCICSQDNHCAPEKGYFCRPGSVFKDARVCRHIDSHDEL